MYDKLTNENVNNTVELFTLPLYFEKKNSLKLLMTKIAKLSTIKKFPKFPESSTSFTISFSSCLEKTNKNVIQD